MADGERQEAAGVEAPARRTYACAFIAAGRVKRADQKPSEWRLLPEALAAAAPLFAGRPCYLDHPEVVGASGALVHQAPKVRHLVGVTGEPVWDAEKKMVVGSLRLYDAAPGSPGYLVGALFDQILDDQARGLPTPPIGLSAVFYHTSHYDEILRMRITDAIDYVESVDVVYDPGAAGRVLARLSADEGGDGQQAADAVGMEADGSSIQKGVCDMVKTLEERYRSGCLEDDDAGCEGAAAPMKARPAGSAPVTLDTLSAQVANLQDWSRRLTGILALQCGVRTVYGMPAPDSEGMQVRGMRTGLDRVQMAVEALLAGTRPPDDVAPLSGIRELYTMLSGDYEMTGRYNPDRVYLANVTSSTMAGLVADALNKRVVNLYATYPKWWEPAVTEEDFTTLQQVKWVTLGGIGELPTVAEGAAYTELTWDDATETASFVKKGGYLGLTIEAIDKDDTGRLRAAPRALAQGAWLTLGKTIASLFTANSGEGPTLADSATAFNTTRGNKGSSAFSHAAWLATRVAMMKATELNSSERLAALAKPHLVWAPVDLEDSVVAELASGEGQVGSANYDVNTEALANALTDRVQRARDRVIVCPFWTDATDWAAQADPRLYPGLGLGYRYGRTPEVFSVASPTAGLMFTNDTMPVKVRFFFATGITDWRAWYKHVVSG